MYLRYHCCSIGDSSRPSSGKIFGSNLLSGTGCFAATGAAGAECGAAGAGIESELLDAGRVEGAESELVRVGRGRTGRGRTASSCARRRIASIFVRVRSNELIGEWLVLGTAADGGCFPVSGGKSAAAAAPAA